MVFALVLLLTAGISAVAGQLSSDDSTLKQVGSLIGTTVSGVFLILIGIINLVVLVGIIKVFRRMRSGHFDEAELEDQLNNRGFMPGVPGPVVLTDRPRCTLKSNRVGEPSPAQLRYGRPRR